MELYYQAFFELDSERSSGFGPSRIPGSAIREYARFYEFDEEQLDALEFYIGEMDRAHLERLKNKAANGKP